MSFERLDTELEGLILFEVSANEDPRGFLSESWRSDVMDALGIECEFVQENHSRSIKGTLRGIHFQTTPGQAKLVRCARGTILDVAVDLRRESPTFGRWEGFELSDANRRQLLVPIGFGHAFCVLSDEADVIYKLSSYYDAATEAGIAWNDPDVNVDWPAMSRLVSERDESAPSLSEIADDLPW
jgi:dTDP-4-dehydrorhamnose 3,5-epimerase